MQEGDQENQDVSEICTCFIVFCMFSVCVLFLFWIVFAFILHFAFQMSCMDAGGKNGILMLFSFFCIIRGPVAGANQIFGDVLIVLTKEPCGCLRRLNINCGNLHLGVHFEHLH